VSFRDKCAAIFTTIKKSGSQSLAQLAKLKEQSKSSLHRQFKKISRRSGSHGAVFFETPEGAKWLRNLTIATVFVFGLKGKVGAPTLALFFDALSLTPYVASSGSSMGRLKQLMMESLVEYEKALKPRLDKLATEIEIITGADETFFDPLMILLFMELSSGFIFVEEAAENRKAETWDDKTAQVTRGAFKKLLCLVSDRGRSLIKWAKGMEIKSIADLFHMQQEIVRLFRFSFASKRRTLNKQEKEAKKILAELTASNAAPKFLDEQHKIIEDLQKEHLIIDKGQKSYREELTRVSITVHPFNQASLPVQTTFVKQQMESSLATYRQIAADCKIPDPKGRLNYFENNIDDLTPLIDLWWQWVDSDGHSSMAKRLFKMQAVNKSKSMVN